MNGLKAVIFDAYGTRLSTGAGPLDATRQILERVGRPDLSPTAFYGQWKELHRAHTASLPAFETEAALFARDLSCLYAGLGCTAPPGRTWG